MRQISTIGQAATSKPLVMGSNPRFTCHKGYSY